MVCEMIYTLTRLIKHDYIAKNWKYKLFPLEFFALTIVNNMFTISP
jgi:hypothetical protein